MKASTKEASLSNVLCKEHKEKCAFVCLFKTCKDAFKIGCMRCRKDHAQHPNRLISLNDFHSMLSKPIRYLQNLTAFKLMNLKKKIEYIRNFRTDILDKETQLMESNKNIKSTIAAILDEHYGITDVVSHIDADTLTKNSDKYAQNLQKCKDFLAYNPVKCELVFNNDVIKNSRILLEKHLKNSHELIDNIREFLVKIIEVLLANCAHDEDDDQIQFAQEGDSATTFNIFIKHRTDVSQNPNIKSKLEHETFLEMFDQQKEAFTKQIQLLEKEISIKQTILKKIKSSRNGDKDSISEKSEREQSSKREIQSETIILQLQNENRQLRQQIEKYQSQKQYSRQAIQSLNNKSFEEYEDILKIKQKEIQNLAQTCSSLSSKLDEIRQKESCSEANITQLCKAQIAKYQQQLLKQKDSNRSITKELQNKMQQYSTLSNKQTAEIASLLKKFNALELEISKKKQQLQNEKVASKTSQEQMVRKLNDIHTKLSKKDDQIEKKDKDVQRQKKKYLDLEKLVEKLKENSSSIQKQSQKWRQQYQNRQKYMRGELQKYQKQLETLKYKSRNDQQRNKNIESRMKDLTKQIEAKNQMIREKDRIIREKEQQLQQKNSLNNSRLKQLETQLKNSRTNEANAKLYEEQTKKYKETKDLLQMSIKKNQELKDKIYDLQSELIDVKNHQILEQSNPNLLNQSSLKTKAKVQVKLTSTNLFTPEQFRIQTVNSQELIQQPLSLKKEQPLKEKKIITNKQQRRLAYLQIKNIFKAVSEDMGILEQRLKENSVIEKVYLKELERKRNQNKILKKQLESIKVYGGNHKQGSQIPNGASQTPKHFQKDKKQAKSPSPHMNKAQTQAALRKKA